MKILVAVDGSKHSRWALQWMAKVPWRLSPQITALHVLDISAVRAPFMIQPAFIGNEPFIRREIKRLVAQKKKTIADTATALQSVGLKGHVRTEKGPVANTVLRRAPKRNGLLVIGSRGLNALDRFMLGSISLHAALHAPCPVFVVKEPPRPLRRVVLAVDGSKPAEKGVRFLTDVLTTQGDMGAIRVIIVHVMPSLPYDWVKKAACKMTNRYAHRLRAAGYQAEAILLTGKPAEEIVKVATRKKADLIVMGAKGLGSIARFLLGSVSMNVVQLSRGSVLIVK